MNKKIVTLTVNPALDISASVNEVLPDIKLRCTEPNFHPGGGGINVARILKRLGGNPTAIFQSSGSSGELIGQLLKEEAIDCRSYSTKQRTRENFIVSDLTLRKQFRFGIPGPRYSSEEVQYTMNLIQEIQHRPDFLVVSGSLAPGIPDDFYAEICQWANNEQIRIILDTSGLPLKKAMKEGCFLVKPNLKELGEIVDKSDLTIAEAEKVAMSLVEKRKVEIVVVSLGENGALMATKDGTINLSTPKVNIISTVGAGDSMVAGLTWAISNDFSNNDILRFGVACGTAATMTAGTELCLAKDVLNLFNVI